MKFGCDVLVTVLIELCTVGMFVGGVLGEQVFWRFIPGSTKMYEAMLPLAATCLALAGLGFQVCLGCFRNSRA